ncbi:MAG: stage II sporulation protein D [Clostridia bacterium]|nr:stage II sporulation protein D [Clostridia bacterium]
MKYVHLIVLGIMFLSILLIPLIAMKEVEQKTEKTSSAQSSESKKTNEACFRVKFTDGKVQNIPEEDYICSVVAAEMPAVYEPEALKAQAVAAYTYACFRRESRKNEAYDVSADSTSDQGYVTMEKAAEKWGDKAKEYTKKIQSAVQSVQGYKITYNGKLILAAYHAISSGKTETGKNVWGDNYEYLTSVESIGDLLAEGYLSSVTFTPEEFKAKAAELNATMSGDASTWLREPSRTETGMVKEYQLGDKRVAGTDMRKAFGLRSANFDLTFAENKFTFTVRGYGHGAGMSQNGANYMAKQGSTFLEILSWYYPECKLEK